MLFGRLAALGSGRLDALVSGRLVDGGLGVEVPALDAECETLLVVVLETDLEGLADWPAPFAGTWTVTLRTTLLTTGADGPKKFKTMMAVVKCMV